jgi:hypothetical protein
VPSTATATRAAITSTSAITQPQLRRFVAGGLGASPRGGMTCGETGFETGAGAVAITSVAGSDGVSILVVDPASKAEGAVYRRSGSSGVSFGTSAENTSVAGS